MLAQAGRAGREVRVDEAKALGWRVRELRCWRGLTLREAAGLAGCPYSFWGQVVRGEKPITNRRTLEAMAGALQVHPMELTEQPWSSQDPVGIDAQDGLLAINTALERFEVVVDSRVPVRA